MGVGTAGDKHNIAFAFSHLKMDPVPHAVVGGDEGLPGKPEPAIFLEAARRMTARAEACIVFEDAPFGIEAARRAGMRAVALCTTHSPAELAAKPTGTKPAMVTRVPVSMAKARVRRPGGPVRDCQRA